MGLEDTKMFHIYANGKTVKELPEKEYLAHLDTNWLVGYVHKDGDILLSREGFSIVISNEILLQILELKKKMEA